MSGSVGVILVQEVGELLLGAHLLLLQPQQLGHFQRADEVFDDREFAVGALAEFFALVGAGGGDDGFWDGEVGLGEVGGMKAECGV